MDILRRLILKLDKKLEVPSHGISPFAFLQEVEQDPDFSGHQAQFQPVGDPITPIKCLNGC